MFSLIGYEAVNFISLWIAPLNPFHATALFQLPQKTSGKYLLSHVSRGYSQTGSIEWVKKSPQNACNRLVTQLTVVETNFLKVSLLTISVSCDLTGITRVVSQPSMMLRKLLNDNNNNDNMINAPS